MAILDADKEGFLRSETSLIQTMGRAARNVDGQVIMYADAMTNSMRHDPQGGHQHPGGIAIPSDSHTTTHKPSPANGGHISAHGHQISQPLASRQVLAMG